MLFKTRNFSSHRILYKCLSYHIANEYTTTLSAMSPVFPYAMGSAPVTIKFSFNCAASAVVEGAIKIHYSVGFNANSTGVSSASAIGSLWTYGLVLKDASITATSATSVG